MINTEELPKNALLSKSTNTPGDSLTPPKMHPDKFVKVIVAVATIGAIAFGYDTGVIAGALPFMTLHASQGGLDLNPVTEGIVASSLIFGAAFGALIAGNLSDKFGRRKALLVLALIFLCGALGTALAPNLTVMVIFRLILGLAVGGSSAIVPMFIAEIAPPEKRGQLVSQSELMIVSGQLLAYTCNAVLINVVDDSAGIWRYMLAIAALPAALLWLGMLFMPESPRWLASNGYLKKARAVLFKIRRPEDAKVEFEEVSTAAEGPKVKATLKDLKPFWIRRLILIGAGLGCVAQFSGVNSIMYFAPTILLQTGLSTKAALVATIANGVISVIATIVGMNLLSRFNRRPIMITGVIGIVAAHLLMGLVYLMPHSVTNSYLVLAVMMVLLFFVQSMVSTVYWLMISVLFPLHVRGMATGIAVCFQWLANALVTLVFPFVLISMGGNTFFIFAAINVVSLLFILKFLPEIKGKSLEELEEEFKLEGSE